MKQNKSHKIFAKIHSFEGDVVANLLNPGNTFYINLLNTCAGDAL